MLISGRYLLQHIIGEGAFGKVFLAIDQQINRNVAVKVIQNNTFDRVFEREIEAIKSLTHPNIVSLHDAGKDVDNAISYLVMPYYKRGSLEAWWERRNRLATLSDVVHIVKQAANALQYAHNRNIVHRDVKASNFLVVGDPGDPNPPNIAVADFGIARFTSTMLIGGGTTNIGTYTHMPPEQWFGNPVAASDQYALAITAYQLLTGYFPFNHALSNLRFQHDYIRPNPPSSINQHLKLVDHVILRALEKAPQYRYPSIGEFALAFEQAIQGIPLLPFMLPQVTGIYNGYTFYFNGQLEGHLYISIYQNLHSIWGTCYIGQQGFSFTGTTDQRGYIQLEIFGIRLFTGLLQPGKSLEGTWYLPQINGGGLGWWSARPTQ